MSALAERQIDLVRKFDEEMFYWLDGNVAAMHVAGVGGKLDQLRRGREANRPPIVTLEPRRNGQIMLGLVVSRPKNGRFVYDTVLGHWDMTVPIRTGGPLNEAKPRHRRVASWGLQLLRAMLDYGRALRDGTVKSAAVMAMPRVMIPYPAGEEKIDPIQQRVTLDALIDTQTLPGTTLVDSRIAPSADVSRAIDNDTALEDFRPVMGQSVPNPFRFVDKIRSVDGDQFIPLSKIYSGATPEILAAARRFLGRGIDGGASDADIASAAINTQQNMLLSLFSKIQVLPVELLTELPEPYAGQAMPPVAWRTNKNKAFTTAVSA